MEIQLNAIALDFFNNSNQSTFTKLYNTFRKIAYSASVAVLKDHDDAEDNVSAIFMKIWNLANIKKFEVSVIIPDEVGAEITKSFPVRDAKNEIEAMKRIMNMLLPTHGEISEDKFSVREIRFEFRTDKPFGSYVYTLAHNRAKFIYNKIKKSITIAESKLAFRSSDGDSIENMLDFVSTLSHTKKSINGSESDDFFDEYKMASKTGMDEMLGKIFSGAICAMGEEIGLTTDEPEFDIPYIHTSAVLKADELKKMIKSIDEREGDLIIDEDGEKKGLFYAAIVENKPYAYLMEKFNLNTEGCIKTRVHRLRKKLKEELTAKINYSRLLDGDKVTGEVKYFDNSTKTLSHVSFKDGLLDGAYRLYSADGSSIKLEKHFNMGVLNGSYIERHENGVIKVSGEYKNGNKHGEWLRRDKNNTLEEKANYFEGTCGYFEVYNESKDKIEKGLAFAKWQ